MSVLEQLEGLGRLAREDRWRWESAGDGGRDARPARVDAGRAHYLLLVIGLFLVALGAGLAVLGGIRG